SKCAWSTTRPVSGGKVCANAGAAQSSSPNSHTIVIPAKARAPLLSLAGSGTPAFAGATTGDVTSASAGVGVEIDARRLLRGRGRLERHLGLGTVEHLGADRRRERADQRIIPLNRLIIVAARRVDAVLRPLQLVLQGEEVLVRFEVGIGFLQPLQGDDRL